MLAFSNALAHALAFTKNSLYHRRVSSVALHPFSGPTDIVQEQTHLPLAFIRKGMCAFLGDCVEEKAGLITAHLASNPELKQINGGYYIYDSPPFVNCGKAASVSKIQMVVIKHHPL
jgi:hypothetical protein